MEERIRMLCKNKGLKMSDLAMKIGVTQSNLMSSIRGNPKLSTLRDIAAALGVPLSVLFSTTQNYQSEGVVMLNGKIMSLVHPVIPPVEIPFYNDYKTMRKDIVNFVTTCLIERKDRGICGYLETYEFFSLIFDSMFNKFKLILYFRDVENIILSYELLDNVAPTSISKDIYTDIEEKVISIFQEEEKDLYQYQTIYKGKK